MRRPGLIAACLASAVSVSGIGGAAGPFGPSLAGPATVDDASLILAREASAVAVLDPGDGAAPGWVAALPAGGLLARSGEDGALAAGDAPVACALAGLGSPGAPARVALALPDGVALFDRSTQEVEWRLFGLEAVALAAGDIDGDGRDDLVAAGAAGGLFAAFASGEDQPLGDVEATAIAVGDFLGKGSMQVAASLRDGGLLFLDPLDGSTTVLPGPVFTGLAAIDVDGDGAAEVVGQDADGGLHAASIFRGEIIGLEPSIAAIEDFDPFVEVRLILPEPPAPEFLRGNANLDNIVDLSDAVSILGDLFLGVSVRTLCRKALDANDSNEVDISDPIYILSFLFLGGPTIPPPYPEPGPDPTPDAIPCEL